MVLFATQLMNVLFVFWLDLGVAGLALSIGLGACINATCLYLGLRRRGIYTPQPGWLAFFIKLAVAVGVMGLLAWFGQAQFDWAAMKATPGLRIGALLGIIAACALAYFAVLAVLGFRPRDFRRRAN